MSIVLNIAEAVVAALNADIDSDSDSDGLVLTAELVLMPQFDVAQLAPTAVKVSVVPGAIRLTNETRATRRVEVDIDVGIQSKLSGSDAALHEQVEELMGLVDEISTSMARRKLAGVSAAWVRSANEPVYYPEHMAENRVFTSVVTLTYTAAI
jgi:hypothetical protein